MKTGDVVIVARWLHAHGREMVGKMACVQGFSLFGARCPDCGRQVRGIVAELDIPSETIPNTNISVPVRWLRRFRPLTRKEAQEAKREMLPQPSERDTSRQGDLFAPTVKPAIPEVAISPDERAECKLTDKRDVVHVGQRDD